MAYVRRHFSAVELAAPPLQSLSWPAVSLGLLCLISAAAPPGLVSAMNLYLLLLVGLVVVASGQRPDRALLMLMLPFVLLIAIGLVGGIGADRYLYLKDAWYFANPALLIAVGYVCGRLLGDTARALRAMIVCSTLIALVHLLPFILHPDLLLAQATRIRDAVGTGYYAPVLAVVVLIGWRGRWREGLHLPPAAAGVALLLCTGSVVVSFSRTILLTMVIGVLAMSGFFARREWLRVLIGLGVAVAALALLGSVVDTSTRAAQQSFVGKLARSFDELTAQERTLGRAAVDEHWRGFETARALDTWAAGNPAQRVFGQGFGKQVDLGLFQNLSRNLRDAVRFIPVLHNGFMYLLVKTGLIGVAIFLATMLWIYREGRRTADRPVAQQATLEGRLLQASALVMVATTWVISGAFNKLDMVPFLLLIGVLVAGRSAPAAYDPKSAWADTQQRA